MKFIILFLVTATLAFPYCMRSDDVIINGRISQLIGYPLDSYPWRGAHPKLSEYPEEGMSDCREIAAIWEIRDGRLYLIAASTYRFGDFAPSRALGLQDLMPERIKEGSVLADWFSGDLTIIESERPAPTILPNPKNRPEIRTTKRHFKVVNGQVEETQ